MESTLTAIRPLAGGWAEDRFRAMFARYHPAVFGYAARRVGRIDAADVAAETFTVAWRRLSGVPEEPATLPWLYGVARNVVANLERSRRRTARLVAKQASYAPAPAALEAAGDLAGALGALSEADREILLLAAWEGLTPTQLGGVLGCTASAAAVRLHRARTRLASAMEGEI